MKILYLARWYPNRYDPMPGLFIQRHAEAVSRYCDVGVVYTHVVDNEKIEGFDIEFAKSNNVPTVKVYYNNPAVRIPFISSVLKATRFFRANHKGIKKIQEELNGIDLVHVHILTRLGVIALWCKWIKKIPFGISEHWSRYLPVTNDFKGITRKWLTKKVVRHASFVTTVTQNLAEAMISHGLYNRNYQLLANVVTDDFIENKPKSSTAKMTTFVHVSCFEDKSKNISGLLRVISSLSKKRNDFVFKLIGDGMDHNLLRSYASELALRDNTTQFLGLREGKNLVDEISTAEVMVIFSNYENFPVVINEGFAIGIPVFATRVGGIPEFVEDSNGRLIEPGDEKGLEHLLNDYLDGKIEFDRQQIKSKAVSSFSYQSIGAELHNLYKSVILK